MHARRITNNAESPKKTASRFRGDGEGDSSSFPCRWESVNDGLQFQPEIPAYRRGDDEVVGGDDEVIGGNDGVVGWSDGIVGRDDGDYVSNGIHVNNGDYVYDDDMNNGSMTLCGSFARCFRWSLAAALLLLTPSVFAQLPGLVSQPLANGGQSWTLPVQTLVLLTSLTFIPAALLMMTSFTRIIIVLSLLRNALGTPSAPPNQILLGLSLFLTFFIMSPVLTNIYQEAYLPFSQEKISMETAIDRGAQPLREFMLRQTREADLALFTRLANIPAPDGPEAVPMRVLLPSFVTSELKTAFQIGFTVFIPFLIIDLVVASVLMALGMMMVPPATVSLPFKLMLFVLVDGWQLLLGSLAQSFYS